MIKKYVMNVTMDISLKMVNAKNASTGLTIVEIVMLMNAQNVLTCLFLKMMDYAGRITAVSILINGEITVSHVNLMKKQVFSGFWMKIQVFV